MKRLFPLSAGQIARLVVLSLGGVIVLLPFIWGAAVSIKPPDEIWNGSLSLWPKQFYGFENYQEAFTRVPMARFLLNGLVVVGGILLFQVLFAIPCAFALAKHDFLGRTTLFTLILVALLIPIHVTAVPLYIGFARLGLLNTYFVLIAPFTITVFGIFLFRQVFKSTSNELLDAARVDGLGEWSLVWRVFVPVAWPAITAFATFSVTAHWNDLFWPFIVITSRDLAPPALSVMFFRSEEYGANMGPLMASNLTITAPLVIAFLLAQRRFVDGIALSGTRA